MYNERLGVVVLGASAASVVFLPVPPRGLLFAPASRAPGARPYSSGDFIYVEIPRATASLAGAV